MSTFTFGELRADVKRLGLKSPDLEIYAVRISDPEGGNWFESKTALPKKDRTSGSDFLLATQLIDYLHQAAEDPKLWSSKISMDKLMSPEEMNVTINMAQRLSPYLNEAMLDAMERMDLYSEYREDNVGPLEMSRARNRRR